MKSKCLMDVLLTLLLLEGLWCQGCWDHERTALLQLKAVFNNPWSPKKWWVKGEENSDCCQWEGVKCNSSTGRVITLNLNSARFQESNSDMSLPRYGNPTFDPMELENLMYLNASLFLPFEELRSLYLARNGIAGCTENEGFVKLSKKLSNLEILNLEGNLFNNSILPSLSEISSLRSLNLGDNKFQAFDHANGFEKLSQLRSLEILDLQGNPLNNSILISLSELPSLQSLYLGNNNFQASSHADGFEKLSELRNLEILDLGFNQLNNDIFTSLSELSSLKSLYLDSNQLNNGIFTSLSELPSLKSLYLGNNNFQASNHANGFQKLSKLRNLKILDLDSNQLNNGIFTSLSELLSLKSLYLGKNNFQASNHANVDFEKLSGLGHLEVLDLSGTDISYNIISYLARLPALKTLIQKGSRLNVNQSTRGFHNLSNVEELFLDYSILPTNFIRGIGALTSLKVLSLWGCGLSGSLTRKGLCELTRLQILDIGNNFLGGALPSCLANLTSLEGLNLDPNFFSGDIALSPLNKLTSLHYLSLSNNHFQVPISLRPFFNHSKLKIIIAENNKFYADTNTESLEPTFQLKTLVLSGYGDCGGIPNFLHSQHNLEHLDLSHLNLTGEFPIWLLENNTKLNTLLMVNNSLSGPIGLLTHSLMSLHLVYLNISGNSLICRIPPSIGDMKFLESLDLSHNNLSGEIPKMFTVNLLQYLDLSHNNLSGGILKKLSMSCSSLRSLTLSNNNLQGQIFSENFSLFQLEELHLDGNHFSGSVPRSLSNCSNLYSIDLSNNNLSGRIPRWMGNMLSLSEIIMPNNGLEGPIPIDFCQLQNLDILDLSNNNISGSLPTCFGLELINHIHLSKNRLEGSLTTQFCKSSSLVTLDLSDNQLSGNIPNCINMLGELSYLILKNNNLDGEIPIQLCKLQKLSLIDLSHNHLSGYIPSCLNITTFDEAYDGEYGAYSSNLAVPSPVVSPAPAVWEAMPISTNEPVHFTTKNMTYSYKGKILAYMSGMDLSCNKLTGKIPSEIGYLNKIRVLNLSHNNLIGQIPSTFSNLVQIESLDLSYNNLSGEIPPQLVELYFLSTFSVSYNNLSGKTPARVKQFATFDEGCYQGNPLLCGEPMKSCSAPSPPPLMPKGPIQGREEDGPIDIEVFCVSFIVSYIMVLVTIAAVLYINPYWRQAWFYYIEMCFNSCYYFVIDHLPKQFH
ncbi:hypothetical protein SLE2022_253930 [Rubroshorea leprosula]